jgi:hypothetical protein
MPITSGYRTIGDPDGPAASCGAKSGRDPLADRETRTMAIELRSAQTHGDPPPGELLLTASSYASAMPAADVA